MVISAKKATRDAQSVFETVACLSTSLTHLVLAPPLDEMLNKSRSGGCQDNQERLEKREKIINLEIR